MPHNDIGRLLEIMAFLRDPERGCPWDKAQTFETIAPYTVEEAYEVADAISRRDMPDLCEELGDLLLQVIYHSRIAEEQAAFTFADVVAGLCDKLIRRHPHVFGHTSADGSSHAVRWDEIKAAERAVKALANPATEQLSLFEGIPVALPALPRSVKIQKRAALIGFDWPDVASLLRKVDEEIAELKAEIDAVPGAAARRFEEFGDLIFVMINLGLHLGIDGEAALNAANAKFMHRMQTMETICRERGTPLKGLSPVEMDRVWGKVKERERNVG